MLLNVDAGELQDESEELAASAHLLNIACGGHAGDEGSMRLTLQRARAHGCRVGAHPSYPDREHFGRRPMEIPYRALEASLQAQVMALVALARDEGLRVTSLKPHGALYHAANEDPALAALVAAVTRNGIAGDAALVGPPRGELERAATQLGLAFFAEGFADRRYEADGGLRDRRHADALLSSVEEAVAQARTLMAGGEVRTLCVHGDSPLAVPILRALRTCLDERP